MSTSLHKLAEKLGISVRYTDGGLQHKEYTVDDKVIRFFIKALGYKADNEGQIESSISEFENKRWKHALEPIYVREEGDVRIDIVSADLSSISIVAENAEGKQTALQYEYMRDTENRGLLYKETLKILTPLAIGYYNLIITISGKKYSSTLAVAPQKCHGLEGFNQKLWGYALQLYSLKSKRNWGVGDFTDLINFVKLCAKDGADIIGLNPLNTLCHDYPENASPYSSISREFLNPIYIDVEKLPNFCPKIKPKLKTN